MASLRVRIILEVVVGDTADQTAESVANEIVDAIDDNYESVTVSESVILD